MSISNQENFKLLKLLLSTAQPSMNINYFTQMISILNKLFKINDSLNSTTKQPFNNSAVGSAVNKLLANSKSNENNNNSEQHIKLGLIIAQLNKIADYDAEHLQKWLSKLVLPTAKDLSNTSYNPIRCKIVLQALTTYLVNDKNIGEVVTLSILSALLQLASKLLNTNNGIGFPELILLMDTFV